MPKFIKQRKTEHIDICLNKDVEKGSTGFDNYRFIHNALPEIDFNDIDTETRFLGKKINSPIMISSMTGGSKTGIINRNLAIASQKMNIAMGVGSQRVIFRYPETLLSFNVRRHTPDIPLVANLGVVNLNYGFGLKECKAAVKSICADALALHLNPLQEAIQPEGQRNYKALLPEIADIVKGLEKPVIIKEVGEGISSDVASRLKKAGVKIIDVAGHGGTSWAYIEGFRARKREGQVFSEWGISTAESVRQCSGLGMQIIASGGIRSGLDMAKAIALGADYCGIALPLLKPATIGPKSVMAVIEQYIKELKIAMFCIGAKNIRELKEKGRKALVGV